jgi:hypothetical protein
MKKIVMLFAALGLSGIAFAQIPGFTIGPKIGFNTTKLSTDASQITSELKSNFQFGAFVRFGNKIYLQPEVNYVTKGGLIKGDNAGNQFSQQVKLKTLTIPLLVGVRIINLKVASVHLIGGPVASFILDKKLSVTDPGNTWPVNSTSDFKSASYALQVGAGVDVLMFTFDIRYEIGLSDVYKTPKISMKNNLLNVSLGLKLF